MTLHILNSPASLDRALPAIAADDIIVLIERAIGLADHLPRELDATTVYLLSDAQAPQKDLPEAVFAINYDDFVALTVAHWPCLSW